MADGHRPFRFAIGLTNQPTDRQAIRESAKQAEDLGYSVVSAADHFGSPSSPFLALLIAAEATTTLRVATQVIDNDFRHPTMLAKEAATLDVLSGGRLELGVGAGWMRSEYERTGISYDEPKVRVERLGETLEILTGLFGDEPYSFSGKHYTISELNGTPKPIQRPRVHLQVGGGSAGILRLGGRFADSISIAGHTNSMGQLELTDRTPERLVRKLGWIAEGAGERMGEIELGITMHSVIVTDDREATAEQLVAGWQTNPGVFYWEPSFDAKAVLESPSFAIGSPNQIDDHFIELRERYGISLIQILGRTAEDLAPLVGRLAGT